MKKSLPRKSDLWKMFYCCTSSKKFLALNKKERSRIIAAFLAIIDAL